MMKSLLVLLCVTGFVCLSGCKMLRGGNSCNKPQPYMAARSVAPLKIPPGLDAPDTSNALKLPTLSEPAAPRSKNDPCLDQPPSFKVSKPAAAPQA
jgi:uncharacterized lipoprotein